MCGCECVCVYAPAHVDELEVEKIAFLQPLNHKEPTKRYTQAKMCQTIPKLKVIGHRAVMQLVLEEGQKNIPQD